MERIIGDKVVWFVNQTILISLFCFNHLEVILNFVRSRVPENATAGLRSKIRQGFRPIRKV